MTQISSLCLFSVIALVGCVNSANRQPSSLSYPYFADAERSVAITSGVTRVSIGMPSGAVKTIIGTPDEINDTFDTIKAKMTKRVGYSFMYLLQRKSETGSVIEKDEKLIRLHFDMNDKLTRIDLVGI